MNFIGKKHRYLSLLLVLTMILSSFITVNANTSDINGHWGQEVLQKWIDLGLLGGYGNGQYRPNGSITRAEFVTLLNKMNNNTAMSDKISQYKDVKPSDWYYSEMAKALAAGYINGTSASTISPTKVITRQEAVTIILNYKGIKPLTDLSILSLASDGLSTSNWAKGVMAAAMEEGYISGSNNKIYPKNNLTRAEAVALLDKVLTDTRTYSFATTYGAKADTKTVSNVVVNCPGTTLQNMIINGDLEITKEVGEGEVNLDNIKVKGNVYVNGGGVNTILFNNVDVAGALVVNKLNGKVRILATGNTNISVTTLLSGAILVERELTGGGFEQVMVPADIAAGQDVVIEGNVNKLENHAVDLDLTINGKVNELSSSTDLSVNGKVEVTKTIGESTIKTPDVGTDDKASTGGSGSSSDSDNSSDSDTSDSNTTVSVQSVKINEEGTTLLVGQIKTFTATVSPSNATNKNLQWFSSDASVAEVDTTGKVRAVSVGTATITAKTVNGGKTDSVTVTVKETVTKKDLSISFSSLSGLNFSEIPDGDKMIDQSKHFDFKGISSTVEESVYVASYVYDVNNVTMDIRFPIVVTIKEDGKPITVGEDTTISLTSSGNDSKYYSFGRYLKEGYKDGSFLLLLDLSEKVHTLKVSDERYNDIKVTIQLIPDNKPIINQIGEITGTLEAGETLTAGEVKADGSRVTSHITYQWYVSSNKEGNYQAISGAYSSTYTIQEVDGGKYFKVIVSGDGEDTFGSAISNAYGPVKQTINTEAIFTEIASLYLGENKDANYVNKALNLMTSLSSYPGVVIEWSSDKEAVNPSTGAIARGEDDVVVKLTATINGATKKDFEIKVLSEKVENVGQTGTDGRFAPGYPRAFVQGGTIHVEFKTVSDAKVYMIVNSTNGHRPSSVEGVLGGYGGLKDALTYINSWPYFETEADKLVSFDTTISVTDGGREKRINFVLKDMDDKNLGDLVTILFDKATLEALDQTGPECDGIKINRDGSKLYLYFNEIITTAGLSASDFSLTQGTVTGIVEVKNYDTEGSSSVVLSVSGTDNTSKLSYRGTSIKDTSIYNNVTEKFDDMEVTSANTVITDVTVGNDGRSIMVEITGGFNEEDDDCTNLTEDDFVITTASGNKIPSNIHWSFNLDWVSYELKFDETLVIDSNSKISINTNKANLFDYAYDTYTASLEKEVTNNLSDITDKTPLSVSYTEDSGQFKMIFDSGLRFDTARFADNFVVRIDGVEYRLRGQLLSPLSPAKNEIKIDLLKDNQDNYSKKIKELLSTASSVKIKYELIHGDSRKQLLDIGAALLPAFDYEDVTLN